MFISKLGKTDRFLVVRQPLLVSLFPNKSKYININFNDCLQMQNDTENEIGRLLFPFIYNTR